MNAASHPTYEYQVGGSLPANSPTYVTRKADQDLYKELKAANFCYVLNSRQMGKSSLRVQTMQRLQTEGIACAAIDLTEIGTSGITDTEWYAGVIDSLVSSFHLYDKFNLESWWNNHNFLSPVRKLSKFIEDFLLRYIRENIVIFIDEIDSVLSLDFNIDDFFALIRNCYNQRADKPAYERLTFTLLGVATPSDLVKDKRRTPFNIGLAIELNGFTLDEAKPLAQGLKGKDSNPEAVLKKVLHWTGGQPFLTQKLCQLITTNDEGLSVDEVVQSRIINNWESQDEPEHLRTIRDRILRDEQRASRLLGMYQQILQQGKLPDDNSYDQIELRLSGLVVEQQGNLRVYNRIYQFVFNQSWVDKVLADLRPYGQALAAWFASNKDESWLLRGQALRDALVWAENKSLSNEDNQFLNVSRELERRELEEALKLHTFKFKDGEASSVFELITLCDKYTDDAEDYLFNGYLETWLVGQGRTDLANMSRKIVSLYDRQKKSQGFERRQCLELFVRELCKDVGLDPYPKIFIQPNILYLGEMPIGYQKRMQLKIGNNGRGFAWGRVTLNSYLPGVRVPEDFDSCNETFYIQLDTLNVLPGEYQGHIVLHLQGLEYSCQISIRYTVSQLNISIEPTKLDLKVVRHDIDFTAGSFKVICQTSGGSLEGKVSTNIAELTVQPHSFKGADLKFDLILNTIFLRPGHHTAKISLETNNGNYEIPVQFRKKIKWRSLVISIVHLIILIELPILIILLISLYILDKFIKSPDIVGVSKFSVGLLLVGVGLLVSIALELINEFKAWGKINEFKAWKKIKVLVSSLFSRQQ